MAVVSSDLPHTGERFLPWYTPQDPLTAYEHVHRYLLACRLAEQKRVLDISSGEGYGTEMLARFATSVVGIDNDAKTIHHARRHHGVPNVHYIRADARHFGLAAHSIDLAVSFETIEHLDDHRGFLASIKHALATDGVLLISTPHKGIYHDASGTTNPFHARELTLNEFSALLERNFRHVRILGQKIIATSVIAAAEGKQFLHGGGPCCFAATEIGTGHNFPVGRTGDVDPRYYIAICSDAEIPRVANSLMVDNHETLLHAFIDAWATDPQATLHQEYEAMQRTFVEQQEHLDRVTAVLAATAEREQRLRVSFLSAHVQLADRDDEIRRLTAISGLLDAARVALEDANEHQRVHILSLEQHAAHLGDTIAEKNEHSVGLEQHVAHLGDDIARKDAYLDELQQHLVQEHERSLGFERYAAHVGNEIARKDAYLGELEQEIARLGDAIAGKDAYLAEVEREFIRLGDAIAEKRAHAVGLEEYATHLSDELARKVAYLDELEQHYRAQSAWALTMQADLQQSTTAILLHRMQQLPVAARPMPVLLRTPARLARLLHTLVARRR